MKLLTYGNPKTAKGEAAGYLTAILHLAPGSLSGRNVCPYASAQCLLACLNTAGRGGIFPSIGKARIRKTQELFADRAGFIARLSREISAGKRRAERLGLKFAVRLNGTSDLLWERFAASLFEDHRDVQFYDYTKVPGRVTPANYHLTFSLAEDNGPAALQELARGLSIAVVFRDKATVARAIAEGFADTPVVNGDLSDLRFLDPPQTIIGLYAKGKARGAVEGFVHD